MNRTVQATGASTPSVMAEIRARTEVMRSAARARGAPLLPPLLMLGTSERVGSNWLSDTLRPVMDQHNEPFRQQLGTGHPLSALNPRAVPVGEVTGAALGAYGRHWLITFVTSKYGTVRQGVKETSLFFALPSLLALFPDSPVAVLSRSPLGVASSFLRSGLFTRWDYRSRYRQMITMTQSGREHGYAAIVPDDDPPGLVALTRLQVLNTVLLAAALDGRDTVHIPYEAAVRSHDRVFPELMRVVPELAGRLTAARGMPTGPPAQPRPADQGDGIYNTATSKNDNLQVWCGDGPGASELCDGPAARWLYGAAWNTPDTPEEISRPRCRHILGCSRGVGIRLVRDGAQRPVGAGELARRLSTWISNLADRSCPLTEIDERLIRVLDNSQADAGLGAHVVPGAREARHG